MKPRLILRGARRIAGDLATIATGPRSDGRPRSPSLVLADLADYARMARAGISSDGLQATFPAERLLSGHPRLRLPLEVSAFNSARHGETSLSLASARTLRRIADSKELRTRERDLADRLLETDPAWLPEIARPPVPTGVRSDRAILHLLKTSLPDRQSGYTIRSAATLRAQVAAGLEPLAVTPWGFPPPRDAGEPLELETIDGIVHHRLEPGADFNGVLPTTQLSRTAELAAALIEREQPAIIHAHSGHRGYEYGLVGAALKANTGRPLVYEVRGFLEASWAPNADIAAVAEGAEMTRRRLNAEARVMGAADGITTLGQAMADELVARGVPADKIVLVPNGIDPDDFAPGPRNQELARALGVEGRWVFGYISNLDHFREGQALLIEATARLIAEGRNVACLIVGDGRLREELEAQVGRAGLAGSVIFTGRVPHDRVRDHYLLLDAFVVPRIPDRAARFTTPLKPYEAMALGVPLVVSDLPALTEITAPDTRGLAFPPGDAEGLAARLRTLMDRPELATAIAQQARAWVLAERTWAANGLRYRSLYEAILDRSRSKVGQTGR